MTGTYGENRRASIAQTISDELDRQSRSGAHRIDIDAMAMAIERVVDRPRASVGQVRPIADSRRINAPNKG